MRKIYGVKDSEVVNKDRTRRDIRTFPELISVALKSREIGAAYIGLGVISAIFPVVSVPLFLASLPFLIKSAIYTPKMPFYIPKTSSLKLDPNDVSPATNKPVKPNGTFYLGVDAETGEEIWLTDSVARQHFFYAGSTGSGKTESLTGMTINCFIYGSGFVFIDGKADLKLPAKIMAIAHRFMRIDDIFMINYITGGKTFWDVSLKMTSNSFNPFVSGSASSISELLKSLLDGEGDVWSKRADDFISGVTRPLVYQRDTGKISLSVKDYIRYLGLKELGLLCGDESLTMDIKGEIYNFVKTLPGMDDPSFKRILKGQDLENNATVFDQFGYITMQIIPVLNMLKGDYGFIFNVVQGHIRMQDVVASRRVLLVLIPALEKSSSALSALGRIVVTALKDMMASGLGSEYEGDLKRNLDRRFTTSDTCYQCICDEAGYYFVEGAFAAMFAQARSLGISMMLAAQDLPALQRASDKAKLEIMSVISNANTKIAGRIEDMDETMSVFTKRASKAQVASMESLDYDYKPIVTRNVENSVRITERDRLEAFDFASMIEGETIIIHKDNVIRVAMFAVFPQDLRKAALNEFSPVPKLSLEEVHRLKTAPDNLAILLHKMIVGKKELGVVPRSDELEGLGNSFEDKIKLQNKPIQQLSAKSIWNVSINSTTEYSNKLRKDFDSLFGNSGESDDFSEVESMVNDDNKSNILDLRVESSIETELNKIDGFIDNTPADVNINKDPLSEVNPDAAIARNEFDSLWDQNVMGSDLFGDDYASELTILNEKLSDTPEIKAMAEENTRRTIDDMKSAMEYPGSPRLDRDVDTALGVLSSIKDFLDSNN